MTDGENILVQFSKIQYRINSNDKIPRAFGTKQLLHQSEIHFIDAIGPGEGMQASRIAEKLGITNGAVTQTAEKLIRKELLVKYKKEDNRKKVFLRLTEEGTIAFEQHRLFHKELNDRMLDYLNALSDEQCLGILGFVNIMDKHLPDLNKEKQQ